MGWLAGSNSHSFPDIVGGCVNTLEPKFSIQNQVTRGLPIHLLVVYGTNYAINDHYFGVNNSIGVVIGKVVMQISSSHSLPRVLVRVHVLFQNYMVFNRLINHPIF